MNPVDLIAMLALLQYLVFGAQVGRARGKYGVKAPAVTGAEGFERAYRVQMNTLELLVVFLPALYVAARYWPAPYVAGVGLIYLIGRALYSSAYRAAPERREMGFVLSIGPVFVLVVAALIGAVLGRPVL